MKTRTLLITFIVFSSVVLTSAFILPNNNTDLDMPCANYAEEHMNWNGNNGCPYYYDFTGAINSGCQLADVDLDRNTSGIQHYKELTQAEIWTTGDGIIEMMPKPGYTSSGLIVTCDVYVHFQNSNQEAVSWTCFVDNYSGPYAPPCY